MAAEDSKRQRRGPRVDPAAARPVKPPHPGREPVLPEKPDGGRRCGNTARDTPGSELSPHLRGVIERLTSAEHVTHELNPALHGCGCQPDPAASRPLAARPRSARRYGASVRMTASVQSLKVSQAHRLEQMKGRGHLPILRPDRRPRRLVPSRGSASTGSPILKPSRQRRSVSLRPRLANDERYLPGHLSEDLQARPPSPRPSTPRARCHRTH